jgi:hypothetical protein
MNGIKKLRGAIIMLNNLLIKRGVALFLFFNISYISVCYSQPEIHQDAQPEANGETEPAGTLALHVWDRYVRRFRRDHNLALSMGYGAAKWHISSFGDISEESYWTEQASLVADYSFHILISGKTGYFLGSSVGYVYTKPEKLRNEFQPSPSWLLPGVRAGLVYNYDASGRVFAGFAAQLERFNELRTHRLEGDWQSISITGESFQMFVGVDLFFALDKALHIAWIDTTTYFPKPYDASAFLVNSKIGRRVQGAEMGLQVHFL